MAIRLNAALKSALENLNADVELDAAPPVAEMPVEQELLDGADEVDAVTDDQNTIDEVREGLVNLGDKTEQILDDGQASELTNDLVNQSLESLLLRLDVRRKTPSLESFVSPEAQMRHSLEAIRDVINNMNQSTVVGTKVTWDNMVDVFKSTEGEVKKYRARAKAGKAEFDQKSSGWQDSEVKGSLNEVTYFFRTEKGQPDDVVGALEADMKVNHYATVEYPKAVLEQLKKLAPLYFGKQFKSKKELVDVAIKVESMPSPTDLFKKEMLGGFPNLSVSGFEVSESASRKPVTVDGRTFDKLAVLASKSYVKQTSSKVRAVLNSVKGSDSGKNIVVTTKDVGTIFDLGGQYLDNAEALLAMRKEFEGLANSFYDTDAAFDASKMEDAGEDAAALKQLSQQIGQYVQQLFVAFGSPATKEVSRALKGSKYCSYLGMRLVHNAK